MKDHNKQIRSLTGAVNKLYESRKPQQLQEGGNPCEPWPQCDWPEGYQWLWAVFENWGQECNNGPACGDFNGDGYVNVDDLLHVLDNWPQDDGDGDPIPPPHPQLTLSRGSKWSPRRGGSGNELG